MSGSGRWLGDTGTGDRGALNSEMKTIDETIEFIKKAHWNQTDKAGASYWKHPVAVMHRLPYDATIEMKLAALLHDVLEDSKYTANDLFNADYQWGAVGWVQELTKPKDMLYLAWIQKIARESDREVIQIKLADLSHNMDHNRAVELPLAERVWWEKAMKLKYRPAVSILVDALI